MKAKLAVLGFSVNLGLVVIPDAMKQFALTLNLKEIMELIDSFPFLEKKEKREMVVYLEGYLCRVGKPDFIKSALRRTCR